MRNKMQKWLVVITAVSFIFVFGCAVSYAETTASGECGADGDNVVWTLDDGGTLVISGSGKMRDYAYNDNATDSPFCGNAAIKRIKIDDGVTSIGRGAFYGCEELIDVDIPNSVTTIEGSSFSYCVNLKSITIPNSVQTMGQAFQGCSGLESITLSNKLSKLVVQTFMWCSSLKSITIPDGVTQIEIGAFSYCSSLKSIIIPKHVSIINNDAFYACDHLETITIPRSVTYIDIYAFDRCDNLNEIVYAGTEEEWKKIYIADHNDPLLNAQIHFANESDSFTVLGETFNKDLTYYSSSWDSTEYNPQLAHLMMTMANAAYDPDKVSDGYQQLGLSMWDSYNYTNYWSQYGTDNICYSIGSTTDNNNTLCLLISLRGSGSITDIKQGTLDWLGDLDLDSALQTDFSLHKNFNEAAEHVYKGIDDYLYRYFHKSIGDSNIKYFVTGHSRGGAVGNLLEFKLERTGKVSKADVYGYNFAVPDTGMISKNTDVKGFDNIFNISNIKDIVSYVPGYTVDTMTSLKQLICSGAIENKWSKWGISVWFEDGIPGAVGGEAHDPERYINYLRGRRAIDGYTENPKFYIQKEYNALSFLFPIQYKVYATYCPVDVEIIDSNGDVIASVIDDKIDYHQSRFGDVMVTTVDDKKMFAVPRDANYTLRIVGTGDGTLEYYAAEVDMMKEEVTSTKCFENIDITNGKVMECFVSDYSKTEDTQLFVIENEHGIEYEILPDGKEVNPIEISRAKAELRNGDTLKLGAVSKDGYRWYSSNTSVATVNNGLVTAVSSGNANIVAETENGAKAICLVHVVEKSPEDDPCAGGHSWKHIVNSAGLLKNGIEYDQCMVCGKKNNEKVLKGYSNYYVKSPRVVKKKKSFTVKWKKQSKKKRKKFSGYQIRYSEKSNMSKAKYDKVSKHARSKTIKKLKSKKKYYVQVRTYKKLKGVTFYSKWSKKMSVKTK